MSEPRVTITLGRTGQVVKRGAGSKRFTGSNGFLSANKRRRVDDIKWRPGGDRVDDSGIGRKDLRLKLTRKRHSEEQRKRILREKLSKSIRPPASPDLLQQGPPQPNGHSHMRQYLSKDILVDMPQEDSLRKYHSSQTMNGLRVRPPDRVWTNSREVSLRSINDPQQVPATRIASFSRVGPFFSKEAVGSSRQTGLTIVNAVTETSRLFPPTGGFMLKSSQVVEPLNVASLLHSLGLGKYVIIFEAEEVDMAALKQMSDKDLKELGVPMGPRKKILLALQPRPKRQPPGL